MFSRRGVQFLTPETFFGCCQLEYLFPWKKTPDKKIIFGCCRTTGREACTLFDAENGCRLLSVGILRSMEENVPQKNHVRLLSDNKQRGLYIFTSTLVVECYTLCKNYYALAMMSHWVAYMTRDKESERI